MSELKLVLRDAERDLSGTVHGSVADAMVAALSADPVTLAELEVAVERFQADGRVWLHNLSPGVRDEPYDAGLVVIDLAARLVVVDSIYSSPGKSGRVFYHDGTQETNIGIRYELPDSWRFSSDVSNWRGLAESLRRERAGQVDVDVRSVVYGRLMIEFLATGCWREFARREEILQEVRVKWIARQKDWIERYADGPQPDPETLSLDELAWKSSPGQERYASPYYDTLKDIHAAWLLTPCAALNEQVPREVLLAEHRRLMHDEQERCHQWSWTESCPRGLDRSSHAFQFSGFGTHELVKYYELVRELLWSCWERLEELWCDAPRCKVIDNLAGTVAPRLTTRSVVPQFSTLGDFLTDEVPRLERVREEWLDTPDPELHLRTPRSIIDRERQRLPEAVSGREAMHDPDCPCCEMLADLPGPTFWHLDGCNMDHEFAFEIYRITREEWDSEQREWAEMDRQSDARWAERKRLGLPSSTPAADSNANESPATGSVWSSSFARDGANVPLGIRLFGLGGHLAELIADLREAGDHPSLIDTLNRDFGNLREVLGQTASQEFQEGLLEPVLAKFSETLTRVAEGHPPLQAKCDDLISQLTRFLVPERDTDDGLFGGTPWVPHEDEPDSGDFPF